MDCTWDHPCSLCVFSGYTPAQKPFVRHRDGTIECHPAIQSMIDWMAKEIVKQVIAEIRGEVLG